MARIIDVTSAGSVSESPGSALGGVGVRVIVDDAVLTTKEQALLAVKRAALRVAGTEWAANAAPSSWQIVGTYGEVGFNLQSIASGNERTLMRFPLDVGVALTRLKALSSAFYINASSVPQPTGVDLTVGHSYWSVGGTKLFDDASARVAVAAGSGGVESSEYVGAIAAGTRLWVHREVDTPAGGGSAFASIPHAAGTTPTGYGRKSGATSLTDLTTASPSGLSNTGYRMAPRAMIGYGVHGYSFAVLGDSIAYNNNDTNLGDGGAVGVDGRTATGGGWVRRAFMAASVMKSSQIPFAMSVRPSAVLNTLRGSANMAAVRAIYPYASVLLLQIGTNDINAGRTAAQLQADVEAEIAAYKAAFSAANPGITPRAIVCTILPRQSNNGTSTAAGGAVSKPDIIAYNALVRAGTIAGQDGYLDPNAAVRDAGDESMWASAADNADGTHPTDVGHAKIAAAIDDVLAAAVPWMN